MNTGIIILNYNDSETTEKFINQIKKYNELNYIIIVDNCSTDNSYKKLKKYESEKIKVIKTNENKGYASGNNYGIKYLVNNFDIDYIIISNPDIIVEEKVIKKLKEDLYKNKNISIISPLIKQNNEILRGWKLPSYKDELLSNINYIHRIARKKLLYNDEHYKNVLSKVDVVSGCFFVSRKEDFENKLF